MNKYIRRSLGVTTLVGNINEEMWKWFEHTEKNNNDEIVKNRDQIRVEENYERGKPKKRWMEVIRGDMKAFGVNMVRDREEVDRKEMSNRRHLGWDKA